MRWIVAKSEAKKITPMQLASMTLTHSGLQGGTHWRLLAPRTSAELRGYPLLHKAFSKPDATAFKRQMHSRYNEICVLNQFLGRLHPFALCARTLCTPTSLDCARDSSPPLLRLMSRGRHVVLGQQEQRHELLRRAIRRTTDARRFTRMSLVIKKYDGDVSVGKTFFGQCFAQIHPRSLQRLCQPSERPLWVVQLDSAFQATNSWCVCVCVCVCVCL